MRALSALALLLLGSAPASAQSRVVEEGAHHLRSGSGAEWSEPAGHPHPRTLTVEFAAAANGTERTLSLYQEDVKRGWRLVLNDSTIGMLHQDENPIVGYWEIPAGLLVSGMNRLRLEPTDTVGDDVWVGRVEIHDDAPEAVLGQTSLLVDVADAASGAPLPARITVVDGEGRLQTVAAESGERWLAVRPGMVYTGNGNAALRLPAGDYVVYATRGFEYGVDSARVTLRRGESARRRLTIGREVPTPGWVGTDTHVHTLTYSGHGDATLEERAITLAGEGVELAVLTDHNVHVDLDSVARATRMRDWFTPVIGNEVTTAVGHFNIFPVRGDGRPPEATARSWEELSRGIQGTGARAVILNHARDIHLGFRPFGPVRHLAVAGLALDGWALEASAMEVLNSGSQQSDPLRLFHDWLGMLNRGHPLAPVGSSDSHDVARYLVGQARTYIRTRDDDPGRIDVAEAVERFRAGAVMASFGLLAEITVAGKYGPGDLVPAGEPRVVNIRVLGPAWSRAERVSLYANGRLIRSERIPRGGAAGVKWSGSWRLPRLAHDVHLVALAEGPGGRLPFWPIAKPYQPASLEVNPRVLGVSGAVWVDADGDGRRTDAHAYAARLVAAAGGDPGALFRALAPYDEAVAAQAAGILLEKGTLPTDAALVAALRRASPATRRGFADFTEEWRESQSAHAAP